MKKLTKAEEEVMQIIWRLERCTVREVIEAIGDPEKIPHSTISTLVRSAEEKGFLDHKAYGRTYEYFPIITKEAYSKFKLKKFVSDYFEGSINNLVSFLVKEKDLDIEELEDLLDRLDDDK